MQKALAPISLLLTIVGLTYLVSSFPSRSSSSDSTEKKIPGAYQAMNLISSAQNYPNQGLPEQAHFSAWKKLQRNTDLRTKDMDVAPWSAMGPLNIAGRTLRLAFNPQNPNSMFAGTASGGLWKTTTAGVGFNAWEYVPTGFPVLGVSTITFNPGDSTTLYIGTGEVYNVDAAGTGAAYRSTRGSYGMGILKSIDGGQNWSMSLDWTYQQEEGIWDIKISEQNPDIVYAATTKGVYKSIDAGLNWNEILDVPMANSLLIHPEDDNLLVVGCGNFQSRDFGIYYSRNAGDDWTKINAGLPNQFSGKIQLDFAPNAPDTIYASIGNGFGFSDGASWICRSMDFGQTWSIRGTRDYSKWQGWFAHDLAVNPLDPDKLAVIGITVWRSNNAGQSIDSLTRGGAGFNYPPIGGPDGESDYVHSDAHDVIYHPADTNIFYVASDGGVHRTLDGGRTFQSVNGGFQTVQFYNGFSNSWQDSTYALGGLQDNGSILYDGTARWARVFGGDGSWSAIDPSNDQYSYVSYQNLNIFSTSDKFTNNYNNATPPSQGEATVFIAPYVIAPSNPNVLYAGRARVYRSTSRGQSWIATQSGSNFPASNPVLSLDVSSLDEDVVYAATAPLNGNRGEVYISQNGGNLWTNITANLPDRYPMDLRVDPTDDAVAYISFSGFGTGHVFKTTNYGSNWTDISAGLPDVPTNAIEVDPIFPEHVYVGNDLGVFVSTDGGTNWEPFMEGLYDATMVFDLKISPSNRKLRAATHGNGAFQRSLIEGTVSIDEIDPYSLNIYPNPVRDLLNLSFNLDTQEVIHAELFDIQGKKVQDLLNERKASGFHRMSFDLRDLASGIYALRISNGEVQSERKVIVRGR
ncbi:MAG: T9SS type A sorting domain-containing protein [Bacteroidota bacterium]